MTPEGWVLVAGALAGVVASLTALVIQTGKLIAVAEQYMAEYRHQRAVTVRVAEPKPAVKRGRAPRQNLARKARSAVQTKGRERSRQPRGGPTHDADTL